MAGHSKWANIRHRKERVDAKRGKVFSRLVKEVTVAAKSGGMDPSSNARLRLSLEKAKEANVPNDNIDRAIKRGGGMLDGGANYTEVRYEGYGVGGAAVLVDCLTDNKNRTFPEVRNIFTKCGGNLGTDGSVAYLFKRCGQLLFLECSNAAALMDVAIENGADDFIEEGEAVEVLCSPEQFPALLDAIRAAGYTPDESDIVMRAENDIVLSGDEGKRMQRLLDGLEDLDDTQQVYSNANIKEE
ncbi:MAG: YebC/PmpR family DNA-binding transcriptional regulator [Proteobacteria bacterium]|nr:YebC/PmpR family DNA-binding transcriptional regulator [Pseudomonadota bacterium]